MQDPKPTIRRAAQAAIDHLAKELSIEVNGIAVVRAEEVDWPDGSVGCPLAGMRYKQVIVNGTFVQLRAGNQLYNYHGAGTRAPTLCRSNAEILPESLPRKPDGGDLRVLR